jgi:hypothetical protein
VSPALELPLSICRTFEGHLGLRINQHHRSSGRRPEGTAAFVVASDPRVNV